MQGYPADPKGVACGIGDLLVGTANAANPTTNMQLDAPINATPAFDPLNPVATSQEQRHRVRLTRPGAHGRR